MEIRNRESGAVTTVSQFKAQHLNTSFPKQITADILDSYGYDVIGIGAQASVTAPYGVSVRDGIEQIEGSWYTRFVAGPVFTDTTDDEGNVTTAADHEAAYRARIDASVAASARTERNTKLANTDWTQLADSSADATAWATYRTALRDLPTAEGFPHNITWPTEPS
tara:strand:- start:1246 stop:1743 length:498 start_codon:yes stop_codon:yes gene_type:complete